jgi:ribosomal-protein-alanine N-acetyltransferase
MERGVITLRPMTVEDVVTVVALEAEFQPKPWSERVFRDELAASNRIYLVAEDEMILGFGGVMVVGDEAHVTNLLVDRESRRRGLGRRLMVGLIKAAVDKGARHLTLEVRTSNQAARRLYAGLGLAPVGVRPGYYDGDDALIMWAHDIGTVHGGGNELAFGEHRDVENGGRLL